MILILLLLLMSAGERVAEVGRADDPTYEDPSRNDGRAGCKTGLLERWWREVPAGFGHTYAS